MVSHYAGPNWAEQTDEVDILLNLTSLYVQTISHTLVPKCPRFMLSTFDRGQVEACSVMQDAGNRELKRMQAQIPIRRTVTDSLFGVGIYRVALATPAESAGRGWGQKGGEPILTRIDREDFAYDNFAGDFSECAWTAHSYRVPLAAVQEDKRFSRHRKDLKADQPQQFDEYGIEKIGVLNRGFYGNEEIEDMVALWEFYLPRHRSVFTFITDGTGTPVSCADGRPLGEQPWIGPEVGPYGFMGYYWVPGSPMPKGPIMDLYQSDLAANMLYRKALGSAERNKVLTAYAQAEDAKRAQGASDGDSVFVEDPKSIQQITYGGENFQLAYGGAQAMRELFDFEGGNLALLGGRSQQAKTATQEQLLNQNAQGSVQDLQETTLVAINDMVSRLCWYWWKHPHAVFRSPATVPGLPGLSHMRYAFPKGAKDERGRKRTITREADFSDLDIQVDSYSLTPSTPQSRLAMLRQFWQQDVMPAMQIMQGQGLAADFNAYFKKVGEYLNDPDVQEILTIREPPPEMAPGGGGQDQPGMPANTNRQYTRVSTSEGTDKGQGQNQITTLLSGKSTGGRQENTTQAAGAA
jgi:hypothetical protein